ncbi:uncharacterized protein EMH_0023280 [Eimeria mitis]|uniref:Uncharacterized protein n=1 Tax=Eimeria mitis TaxID=44415 RepID=U6KFJ9_9EIME|nr:uncharacterized protein EMH_0023280 [Eimeria mitis]CDJ36724.1 hypothetical protein EMH_0023280 [Eimeria mitis]
MRPADAPIEVLPPVSDARMHLSALPTAFASSMIRGVETVSEEKGSGVAPTHCRGTEENDRDMHVLRRDGLVKTAVSRDSIHLTPEEWEKWAQLKEVFSGVFNNKELPVGRPPARCSMHRIEIIPDSAPRFVPRYRRPQRLEEGIERQADELLKMGKVQPSTSGFGHNPVLVKKRDGGWSMYVDFKQLNKITVKQKYPMPRVDENP